MEIETRTVVGGSKPIPLFDAKRAATILSEKVLSMYQDAINYAGKGRAVRMLSVSHSSEWQGFRRIYVVSVVLEIMSGEML